MTNTHQLFQEAISAHRSGNSGRVIQLCDQILENTGDQPEVLNLKAVALAGEGRLVQARSVIMEALQASETDALSETRAKLLEHASRISSALDLFEEASRFANEAAVLRPGDSAIAYQCARLAMLRGDMTAAQNLADRCLDTFPAFTEATMLRAEIAMQSREPEVAAKCYENIIAAEPWHARAWAGLAEIRRSEPDDERVVAGLSAIHKAGPDGEQVAGDFATATFALADAHARAGDYKTAFRFYSEANQILAAGNPWDIESWQARVSDKIGKPLLPVSFDENPGRPQPLFVVGMPRSGSTLLERMLGAHSLIAPNGERQAMAHIERHLGSSDDKLATEVMDDIRALYRAGMRAESETLWVCDKANRNFERVGLMQQLFPASKIIWIIRNPLDTILSCYFQDFQRGLNFSHSLDHLTRMYCGHWELLKHGLGNRSDSILTIQYQNLVSQPEAVMRLLCYFLGLEFEPQMLHPHLQFKPARTASALQVQEPINRRSLGRWRDYEEEFRDVFNSLCAAKIIDGNGEVILPGSH